MLCDRFENFGHGTGTSAQDDWVKESGIRIADAGIVCVWAVEGKDKG